MFGRLTSDEGWINIRTHYASSDATEARTEADGNFREERPENGCRSRRKRFARLSDYFRRRAIGKDSFIVNRKAFEYPLEEALDHIYF